MGKIVNKRDLSDIIGVSERTLTDWQHDGLPVQYSGERGESNQYDTEQVISWMIARSVGKVLSETQKDRLARLQGDKVEIEIAEKMAKLIPVEQIGPAWESMVSSARSFLRAEPDRLAHLLEVTEGVDAKRDLIAEIFDEFLRKLSEYESAADADEARGETIRTASKDECGGMGGNLPLSIS